MLMFGQHTASVDIFRFPRPLRLQYASQMMHLAQIASLFDNTCRTEGLHWEQESHTAQNKIPKLPGCLQLETHSKIFQVPLFERSLLFLSFCLSLRSELQSDPRTPRSDGFNSAAQRSLLRTCEYCTITVLMSMFTVLGGSWWGWFTMLDTHIAVTVRLIAIDWAYGKTMKN